MCICMISNISLLNDDWRLTTDDSIHSQRLRVLKAFSPSPVDSLLRTNGVYGQSEITPSLHHSIIPLTAALAPFLFWGFIKTKDGRAARGQGVKGPRSSQINGSTG